eukprot:1141287-Pelagomonas_calceolata.AAC.1
MVGLCERNGHLKHSGQVPLEWVRQAQGCSAASASKAGSPLDNDRKGQTQKHGIKNKPDGAWIGL